MAMDGDPTFLPQEIITNILKRLPVKSLIRFQCVCRHWKNLIKTPSFIADHCHHPSNQNPCLLLQWDAQCDPLHLHLLDHEMRLLQVQRSPSLDSLSWVTIVGTSNGLLCLEVDSRGTSTPYFLLWNPAIREVRQLPRTISSLDGNSSIGFGFSAIINDYKIVLSHKHEFDKEDNRVEVYSLSTGSWKEIEVGNFGGICLHSYPVSVNGAIFWYGHKLGVKDDADDDDCDRIIVSFDIAMEVFTLIPMPDLSDSVPFGPLAIYENKLALFSRNEIEISESCLIGLWVMEEGIGASRERWSWTNINTICTPWGTVYPFGIWRNGIVCNVPCAPGFFDEGCETTVLSLYNLSTYELEDFTTRKCGILFSVTLNYAESLVPVHDNHIEEPSS